MCRNKGKAILVLMMVLSLGLSGSGSPWSQSADKIILAATQTNTSQQKPVLPTAGNAVKLKNTTNQPVMPLMPLKPNNPAEPSSSDDSISGLKSSWQVQERNNAGQLKTQWENRRNSLWEKKTNKVLNKMQTKKENIHSKGKGKSSKTEISARNK